MAEVSERRQVKVHLSLEWIASLIDAPADVLVARFIPRQDPDGIDLLLESPRLERIPPGAEVPFCHDLIGEVATDDETGKRYFRYSLDI